MQRWISVGSGVLAVGLSVYLVTASYKLPVHEPRIDAAVDGASVDAVANDAATVADGDPIVESDAAIDLAWSNRDGGIGFSMPDGTPVPPLPDGTPREVKLGVVLVTYLGAQGLAPGSGRPKDTAREQAQKLAQEAQADFKSVVHRGDSGSSEDVGRVRRGILEPAVEYAVFTLPVGGVSGWVDTPRGFWIVKRIE